MSSRRRTYETGAKRLFKALKKKFYDQFLERKKKDKKIRIITDKLGHYKKGFNKYLRNIAVLTFGVPIACKKYGLKRNNNCIERDHQYNKQKYKTMRGHSDFKSADELYDFLDVYYNFLDEQKLKGEKMYRTPAQRAGIKLRLPKKHRLLEFIRYTYNFIHMPKK